jgi:hypothetical protein
VRELCDNHAISQLIDHFLPRLARELQRDFRGVCAHDATDAVVDAILDHAAAPMLARRNLQDSLSAAARRRTRDAVANQARAV